MATYIETAKAIVKSYIKSAIFIDENALEPYQKPHTPIVSEEALSVSLHKEFRQNNISLSTYRYRHKTYKKNKTYLLGGRDLILLDWKLNGNEGEDYALEILNDVVSANYHIPFCVVYTSERQTGNVFNNILSFFSGVTQEDSDNIKLSLLLEDEDNGPDFLRQLSDIVHNGNYSDNIINAFKNQFQNIFENEYFNTERQDIQSRLLNCWCAYNPFCKAASTNKAHISSYNSNTPLLIINETFILILNKQETTASLLQERYSEIISNYENGFSQLLKLELSSLIKNKGFSINAEMSYIKKDTYAYHKKQNKEEFENFIKSIILDGISVNLLDSPLTTVVSLNTDIEIAVPSSEELIRMNTFYNSIYRQGEKKLTFGDVFQLYNENGATDFYYVCINPLCDCSFPKNENTFYFAQGKKINLQEQNKELTRSEEIFISYIPGDTMIRWAEIQKGKPTYITPIPLTVPKFDIKDNIIYAYQLQAKISKKRKYQLHYITTLKQNYAQRIANHAFTHSTRVGISYIKKDN